MDYYAVGSFCRVCGFGSVDMMDSSLVIRYYYYSYYWLCACSSYYPTAYIQFSCCCCWLLLLCDITDWLLVGSGWTRKRTRHTPYSTILPLFFLYHCYHIIMCFLLFVLCAILYCCGDCVLVGCCYHCAFDRCYLGLPSFPHLC